MKLIAVAGLPCTGKSTLAKGISDALHIRHVDIDDNIRLPIFGLPHPDSYKDPLLKEQGIEEMGQSYDLLLHSAEAHMLLGRSVIITATFSRLPVRTKLILMERKYPGVELYVIWCHGQDGDREKTIEEIKRRLSERKFGVNYFGGCNTIEHWLDDETRYPKMNISGFFEIDTISLPPEQCIERAKAHVLSPPCKRA